MRKIKNKNFFTNSISVLIFICIQQFQLLLCFHIFICFFQVAKDFVNSNLKFAISSEEEFADEIKNLGFEDSGEDVSVGCFTEKQKFRMKPTEEFETEDLVSLHISLFLLVKQS